MKVLLARLAFWRRRDDLTWDEIVDFLSGPEPRHPTFAELAAQYVTDNALTLDPKTTEQIGRGMGSVDA